MSTDQSRSGERSPVPDAYDDLVERYRRVTYLHDAGSVLGWDQQVTMPEGGTPARSKQSSAVSAAAHEALTDDAVADLLADLDEGALPGPEASVVREIRRRHRRAARVPSALVERVSEASAEALPVWKEAKAESDFDTFAPALAELLDLKRRYADHVDPDADPYEVLFADYEPWLDLGVAERVLGRLREELTDIVDAIRQSDTELAAPFDATYEADAQRALCESVLDTVGYDWERGRFDTAPHPFSTGTQFDARVTTRFAPEDPLDALSSTVHEFGHASYTLGLPDEQYGTPLGDDRGMTVHESQSRLWENHVGRSRAFFDLVAPAVTDHLGVDAGPRALYEAANRIYPDNCIRVEADELTYHMHIVLRFEIERDLVAGDLDVAEVPAVWNEKMDEYLGVRPETDAEGCLQDIHWSHGSFGYFPTYSLGSVLAAQLFAAAERDIDGLDASIRAGEFDPLHAWLADRVHRHGQRYTTGDLIAEATGEPLTADYFLDYVRAKFGALYDLDLS